MVQMGEHLRDDRRHRLLEVWHDTTRKLSFVFFPLVALLIVSALPLITLLFTKAYAASVPIFMVWSLSVLSAAFQTDGVLRSARKSWLFFQMPCGFKYYSCSHGLVPLDVSSDGGGVRDAARHVDLKGRTIQNKACSRKPISKCSRGSIWE